MGVTNEVKSHRGMRGCGEARPCMAACAETGQPCRLSFIPPLTASLFTRATPAAAERHTQPEENTVGTFQTSSHKSAWRGGRSHGLQERQAQRAGRKEESAVSHSRPDSNAEIKPYKDITALALWWPAKLRTRLLCPTSAVLAVPALSKTLVDPSRNLQEHTDGFLWFSTCGRPV